MKHNNIILATESNEHSVMVIKDVINTYLNKEHPMMEVAQRGVSL